ncbi:MAG TPA: hypothetical protein VFP84_07365 [Kofleriaceae bacterium]|nr:hypothetical protein [Kofleriaceae bacterium]
MKQLKRVDGVWYLVTGSEDSFAVRRITESARAIGEPRKTEVLTSQAPTWDAQNLWMPGDRSRTRASTIPVTLVESWRAITGELDRSPQTYRPRAQLRVPETPLRDLCAELRALPADVHAHLQRVWTDHPAFLGRRFLECVRAYEDYENDEDFVPARRSGKSLEESNLFASEVVRRMHGAQDLAIDGETFLFAGYEVSPRRTTGAARRDDASRNDSGAGGIDALLTNGHSLTVVELKSRADSTLVLALVQALMYAAELTSESQRDRLATRGTGAPGLANPLDFLRSAISPFLDVMLLVERGGRHRADSDAVGAIADQLLNGAYDESKLVRQHLQAIRLVEAELIGDGVSFYPIWQVRPAR